MKTLYPFSLPIPKLDIVKHTPIFLIKPLSRYTDWVIASGLAALVNGP